VAPPAAPPQRAPDDQLEGGPEVPLTPSVPSHPPPPFDRITLVAPWIRAALPPGCDPLFSSLARLSPPNFVAHCRPEVTRGKLFDGYFRFPQ
jgi:hypothetical protein